MKFQSNNECLIRWHCHEVDFWNGENRGRTFKSTQWAWKKKVINKKQLVFFVVVIVVCAWNKQQRKQKKALIYSRIWFDWGPSTWHRNNQQQQPNNKQQFKKYNKKLLQSSETLLNIAFLSRCYLVVVKLSFYIRKNPLYKFDIVTCLCSQYFQHQP